MPLVNALDEQRKLILKNRNTISINHSNSFFFETKTLADANPYLLSKVGIINMHKSELDVNVMFDHFISTKLPKTVRKISNQVKNRFEF